MPKEKYDRVATIGINDPLFWNTPPQAVWPQFRPQKISLIKRFIQGYEANHPDMYKIAEELRTGHIPHEMMDFARWHLVRLQRFSVPSQISDTVEDMEWLVANQKKHRDLKIDGLLFIYMGVGLTKRGGRDLEAISAFKQGFKHRARDKLGPRDTLWGRAFYSRVLRRQGFAKEADEQEEWLRKRVREEMPTGVSGRRELLPFLLDDGETTNTIVERIGWDYFNAPEIRTPDGSIFVLAGGNVALHTTRSDVEPNEVPIQGTEAVKGSKECAIINCHVKENLKKCSRCLRVSYCSKEHQKLAWKAEHKYTCRVWKDMK